MAAKIYSQHQGRRHGRSLGRRQRPHEQSTDRHLGRRTTLHDTGTQISLAQQLDRLGRRPRQHVDRRKQRQDLRQEVTTPTGQTPNTVFYSVMKSAASEPSRFLENMVQPGSRSYFFQTSPPV